MFKKLAKQLKSERMETSCFPMSSPVQSLKDQTKNSFLKSLSRHALNLYERKTDVNNFTRLALSDPENTSHNQIVDELFGKEGVVDPFSEDALFSLSDNERLMILAGTEDPERDLEEDEILFINQLRENNLTPQQYIQAIQQ